MGFLLGLRIITLHDSINFLPYVHKYTPDDLSQGGDIIPAERKLNLLDFSDYVLYNPNGTDHRMTGSVPSMRLRSVEKRTN
jgi:hypothetical protein